MVTVIFFGSLGDHISPNTQSFDLNGQEMTAEQLFAEFADGNPGLAEAKSKQPINVALNQKIAHWEAVIKDGDEVAFLPPVTGG